MLHKSITERHIQGVVKQTGVFKIKKWSDSTRCISTAETGVVQKGHVPRTPERKGEG